MIDHGEHTDPSGTTGRIFGPEGSESPFKRPEYPAGPLNDPDDDHVAVRVSLDVRYTGQVDLLIPKRDVERYGSLDAAVGRWSEEAERLLLDSGAMGDVEIDDAQVWSDTTSRWEQIEEDDRG